jgi:hypothetical protein
VTAKTACVAIVVAVAARIATPVAQAWHEVEHMAIARKAVALLPDSVPTFFREGGGQVAHGSVDPDVIKVKSLPQLRSAEHPEHYIDWELIDRADLPATRYEFIELCRRKKQRPQYVGLLPYAVMEWTQRLTVAFAEHRRWPDNPYIRSKCLVYAGVLAHYLADLNQPLHTTIHWDGRAAADGASPRTGIHHKVDGLLRKVDITDPKITAGLTPRAYESLPKAVQQQLAATHKLVDRVYELEAHIPGRAGTIESQAVREFARERLRASIAFTADILLTAWEDSAHVKLESWLDRAKSDAGN